jgi:MASE1
VSLLRCPYCGVPTAVSLLRCPYCGVPTAVSLLRCPYCGVPTAVSLRLFAPLIIAWKKNAPSFYRQLQKHYPEATIILFLVVVVSQIVFGKNYPLEYCLIPLMMWATFRFQDIGATLLMVIVTAMIAIVGSRMKEDAIKSGVSAVKNVNRFSYIAI